MWYNVVMDKTLLALTDACRKYIDAHPDRGLGRIGITDCSDKMLLDEIRGWAADILLMVSPLRSLDDSHRGAMEELIRMMDELFARKKVVAALKSAR